MTAVVCGILGILFSLSGQELLAGVQSRLEQKVAGAADDIRYDDGELTFDSDIMDLEYGVYLSIYDADGRLLYGRVPYDFDNSALFEDGSIRKFTTNNVSYYLLDFFYAIPDYGSVVIRGVSSITEAEASYRFTIRLAMILLPLLVILTAVTGYRMTQRTLRPVARITETVRQIQNDGDLSRRVALGEGNDEIYRLAETFDQMLTQVEESFQRERQFSSDVSHELRTPVASVMLQCEDLLEREDLTAPVREGLLTIDAKTQYLSQMISQLLFLTRADQGRQKLELEELDFGELTLMACEEAREMADRRQITIKCRTESGLLLRGDETLLIRFWMNLLNNAVTYGKEQGHILVTAGLEGGRIKGEIRDDGIGIRREDLPHIWERFYQADTARTAEGSSGLGLSMVRWIVTAHGGEISVRSRFGEGTVFSFSFPAAQEKGQTCVEVK
ncbi:ATPase/histidine kinase/DNA gyrase B/HSP90 domain protein [Marvinbryantia formatexigens DSM 14469]|uniref:histidine kinase n=2 Tax=Marvinbryantia TaxID=248744 RepID=C6LJC0_9FIRM|nr:ATPase/histidine kinase/DNA gyrase B/HSP90 domain protein [Marvinbryantia formatexigens DSM 14469]